MDTIILLFIALIAYGIVIFGPGIANQRLKKLRLCSKKNLAGALFMFMSIKQKVTLAEISNHFSRPMDEIKQVLQRSSYYKVAQESLDKKDPGCEIWSFG